MPGRHRRVHFHILQFQRTPPAVKSIAPSPEQPGYEWEIKQSIIGDYFLCVRMASRRPDVLRPYGRTWGQNESTFFADYPNLRRTPGTCDI